MCSIYKTQCSLADEKIAFVLQFPILYAWLCFMAYLCSWCIRSVRPFQYCISEVLLQVSHLPGSKGKLYGFTHSLLHWFFYLITNGALNFLPNCSTKYCKVQVTTTTRQHHYSWSQNQGFKKYHCTFTSLYHLQILWHWVLFQVF